MKTINYKLAQIEANRRREPMRLYKIMDTGEGKLVREIDFLLGTGEWKKLPKSACFIRKYNPQP
jgi:hypothetical protein